MFYQILERFFVPDVVPFHTTYEKLDSEMIEKNGVLSRVSRFKKFDNDMLNQIQMNDFSLSNILAVGSYDMLKPTYMVDTNNLNVVGQVEETLKTLSHEQPAK